MEFFYFNVFIMLLVCYHMFPNDVFHVFNELFIMLTCSQWVSHYNPQVLNVFFKGVPNNTSIYPISFA
jgi:hypothetical protein